MPERVARPSSLLTQTLSVSAAWLSNQTWPFGRGTKFDSMLLTGMTGTGLPLVEIRAITGNTDSPIVRWY